MSRVSFSLVCVTLVCLYSAILIEGHSWLDCVNVVNPLDATFLGNMNCGAYPRGYVGRSNPDANMRKIEGITKAQWYNTEVCNTRTHTYSQQYPMLRTTAGSKMTIAYTPNGHTMWHKPPPPNGPRDFWVYWTGVAGQELIYMKDLANAKTLLQVQFDTPCHNRRTGAELDSSAGLCQADVTIPAGTPPGTYQFVWWWPFDFQGGSIIEEYLTCWDVEILPSANTGGSSSSSSSSSSSATSSSSTSTSSTSSSSSGSVIPDGVDYVATMDAYVRSGAYGGNAYGVQDPGSLAIKGTGQVDDYAREAFLKFDISSVGVLKSAALVVQKMGDVAPNFDVAIVSDDSWQEGSITWNNKLSSGSVVGHVGASGVAVLNMGILGQISSDKTISLKLVDNSNSNVLMNIYSKEAGSSTAPKLRITGTADQGSSSGQGSTSSGQDSSTSDSSSDSSSDASTSDSSTSDAGTSAPSSTSDNQNPDSGTNPIEGDNSNLNGKDNASALINFSWGLIICAVSFMLWM